MKFVTSINDDPGKATCCGSISVPTCTKPSTRHSGSPSANSWTFKEQRVDRERAPAHDAESQSLGQIAEVNPDQDFGYLLTKEGGLLYFHRNSVLSGDFDHLSRGDEVHYNDDIGDTGPIATKVRVKERR